MERFLPEKLQEICLRPRYAWAIVLVNLAGTAFGFYYYLPQFSATPAFLWILIADSPLATLAIAASLTLYLKNRQNRFIDAFAFIANIKYGLWTAFVLLYYFPVFYGQNPPAMYFFLLLSHLAMFLQASLILDYTEFDFRALIPVGLWFIVNDLLDYTLDIHPCISASCNHSSFAAMIGAFSLTLIGILMAYRVRKE